MKFRREFYPSEIFLTEIYVWLIMKASTDTFLIDKVFTS